MFIWVLLLVLAIVVGNWLLLRPSAQDRALMQQRRQAEALGYRVRLQAPPTWLGRPVGSGLVAVYQQPRSHPWIIHGRWRWHEGLANWQPVDQPEAWAQQPRLQPPPPGVLGLDISDDQVLWYWQEDGNPDTLAQWRIWSQSLET